MFRTLSIYNFGFSLFVATGIAACAEETSREDTLVLEEASVCSSGTLRVKNGTGAGKKTSWSIVRVPRAASQCADDSYVRASASASITLLPGNYSIVARRGNSSDYRWVTVSAGNTSTAQFDF